MSCCNIEKCDVCNEPYNAYILGIVQCDTCSMLSKEERNKKRAKYGLNPDFVNKICDNCDDVYHGATNIGVCNECHNILEHRMNPPKSKKTIHIIAKYKDNGEKPINVYIVSNKAWGLNIFKVGVTEHLTRRLGGYQTGDPYRAYQYRYILETPHANQIESMIHDKFEQMSTNGEWITGDINDIMDCMMKFHIQLESS